MKKTLLNIAIVLSIAMFFSCANNASEVRDYLADKNLPIGVSEDVYNIHTDSGRVTSKLQTPLLHNFSNRKEHPYTEFPEGLRIVTFDRKNDSLVVLGDYAIVYSNTYISEIKGNVIITSYAEQKKLKTSQLYWDQRTNYFYTEKPFTLFTSTDTIKGVGFDANESLSKFIAKKNSGYVNLKEN